MKRERLFEIALGLAPALFILAIAIYAAIRGAA